MELALNKVLVVPDLKKNLLSASQLTKENECFGEFSFNGFVIRDYSKRVLAIGYKKGKLYVLYGGSHQALNTTRASSELWPQHMGHPNSNMLKLLNSKNFINICC